MKMEYVIIQSDLSSVTVTLGILVMGLTAQISMNALLRMHFAILRVFVQTHLAHMIVLVLKD